MRYLPRLLLVVVVAAVILFAVEGEVGKSVRLLEGWIEGHPLVGPVVFVGLMVALTSVFVPDTLLAVAAGVAFGLVWGSILAIIGALATATVNFFVARWFIRERIDRWLCRRRKLSAIRAAVDREGLKLLALLRMTPISAVAISYVMGTTRLKYIPFLLGTLPVIPMLFVEVYAGHVATHLTKVATGQKVHSPLETVVTVVGLLACIAVLVYITRTAKRALAESEKELPSP